MEGQEIDLVDYIKVILKRKWIIIGVTIGAIIIAGISTLLLPKTYKVSAILEIGQISTFVPETSIQLQEKLNRGSYNELLREKLNITSIPGIEVSAPKDTNLVVMETITKNPQEGTKVLEALSNIIIDEHGKLFGEQKKFIQEDIRKEELKIAILEKSKSLPELQYLYVEHLSRIDELKNELATANPTRLIKAPSEAFSSQNILINVVIAGILGIFIGTLIAFFQEFMEKNKERLKE